MWQKKQVKLSCHGYECTLAQVEEYALFFNVFFFVYLRFSELNSDSRNLRNCSLPTGSLKTSSMPKAHLFTLCWPGSLLEEDEKNNATHLTQVKFVFAKPSYSINLKALSNFICIHLNIFIARMMYPPGFELPERGVI